MTLTRPTARKAGWNVPAPFGGTVPTPLEQILTQGYAFVGLDGDDEKRLRELYSEAGTFFALDRTVQLRHSVADRNIGFREQGIAYAGFPEDMDLNDSFLYWKDRRDLYPNQRNIGSLLDALDGYETVVSRITNALLVEMVKHYQYRGQLSFRESSLIQINCFNLSSDRDLWQFPHEDATFLTVITADSEGLEMVIDGVIEPVDFGSAQMLVMPGGIMTLMTGGEIRPLYHQVRNTHRQGRLSLPYFVSLDATSAIEPFAVNDFNRLVDIRKQIEIAPTTFGLKGDFPPRRNANPAGDS